MLDVLKEKDVKGTFFLNGAYIESSPDLVKRMVDEGHVVGNHGRNHENMSRVDAETFLSEVESNNDLLKASVPGAKYMSCYRPPYGTVTEWDMALAQEMGLRTVLYSWTYYDYDPDEQAAPADALSQAERGLHDGCVYMFHTVGSTNAAIIGDLIDFIRAEGYTIELIG
ncbi:MAG: polysaccharide deacetylase family protein [Clostridia bacterium]|nr:polysaccharide deacetylase family protein [Clostridia bacterium]